MSDRNASVLTAVAEFLRQHPPALDAPFEIVVVHSSICGPYWELRQGGYTLTFTESFQDVVADLTIAAAVARRLL